jgi:ribonuclease HI
MEAELKKVVIYADGAAEPNPGPGGYGTVLLHGGHRKELMAGFRRTTNNRMELRAVIAGLEALKSLCDVTIYSDSKYVVEAMANGWAESWRSKEWLRKGKVISNVDLWKRLMELCDLHRVEFRWVKGHAGDVENERCDALSMLALAGEELEEDEGYAEEARYTAAGVVAGSGRSGRESSRPSAEAEAAKKAGKVVEEGQACRKCGIAVERRIPKQKEHRGRRGGYWYEYYLYCPGCRTMYMVEAAKRFA